MRDELTDLKEPVKLAKIPYGKTVRRLVEENDSPVAKLLLKHYNEVKIINLHPKGHPAFYESGRKTGIRIDMEKAVKDPRGRFQPLFHEIGHNLDCLIGHRLNDRAFRAALQRDSTNILLAFEKAFGEKADSELAGRCRKKPEKYHSIGDIIGGAANGKFRARFGHGKNIGKEIQRILDTKRSPTFVRQNCRAGKKQRDCGNVSRKPTICLRR